LGQDNRARPSAKSSPCTIPHFSFLFQFPSGLKIAENLVKF
jgi:hypothetical protein